MQIIPRFYRSVIVCCVIGLHEGFLKIFLVGLVLMDCVACLKHLILDYELGCGSFLFGIFKQVSKFLCLFLFGVGMKFLYPDRFSRVLFRFLCDSRGEKGESRNGSVPNGRDFGKLNVKSNHDIDFVENVINSDSDEEYDAAINVDGEKENAGEIYFESDVTKLRKTIQIERQRASVAVAELAKERAASASAAEEAMAMILRLQNEKSLLELELSQYKRLAEQKQIHDQEVIRSLQWLVWRHESERSLLEDRLKLYGQKWKRCSNADEDEGIGNIFDALENVLYSSRDANFLSSH